MPKYRYEGKAPMYCGGRISYGDIVELPAPPNRLFVEIEEPIEEPVVVSKPVRKPKKTVEGDE